ncbi:hypothetical protein [Thermomonospora echinospora]|uniref:hypothetical protein n=1 Tax=Thermomonospora echinospora TaxID=1992 RepID=UPI0011B02F3F|nr:hypothetical protein [Thermomonospora echinospora]
MKRKSLFALAGAAAGAAAVTVGVVAVLVDGDGGTVEDRATLRPAAGVTTGTIGKITAVLQEHGATGCRSEQSRVECRLSDRYVAAQVVDPRQGLTMDSLLPVWKSGTAQAATGDRGPFAVLQGAGWLVTGPDTFVDAVRGELSGRIVYCDRPYSTCK